MSNVWETKICDVTDENTRSTIQDLIDQYYWSDDGSETDGPNYLIESSELKPLQIRDLHLTSEVGTYLDGYQQGLHQDVLNEHNWKWTGWQAEGYALILAPLAEVEQALSQIKTTE